jgi:hypothetical protein
VWFPGNRRAHLHRLLNEGAAPRFESEHLSTESLAGRREKAEFAAREVQIVVDLLAIAILLAQSETA